MKIRMRSPLWIVTILCIWSPSEGLGAQGAQELDTPVASQESPVLAGQKSGTADADPTVTVHPEAARAIRELRSPYCPGLMLEVCTSAGGAHLRDSIDMLARSGMTADEIVEGVLDQYGEEWRAVPRREGFGWWAWVMPPIVLAAGLGLVAFLLSRRARGRPLAPGPEPDAGQRDKLQNALDELEAAERPEW